MSTDITIVCIKIKLKYFNKLCYCEQNMKQLNSLFHEFIFYKR